VRIETQRDVFDYSTLPVTYVENQDQHSIHSTLLVTYVDIKISTAYTVSY